MTPITRIVEPYVTKQQGRSYAVFRLSEAPDPTWISKFKERASSSGVDPFTVKVTADELAIGVRGEEDLRNLAAIVERLLKGTNIETGRL